MERETFFERIYEKHREEIKYLDVVNKRKIVILFSSIPGAGKSTISDILEEYLKSVRFNADKIRNYISQLDPSLPQDQVTELKRGYSYWFLKNILSNSPNGNVILDFSVDRSYEELLKELKKLSCDIVLIELNAPLEVLQERIKRRNPEGFEDYLKEMDRWSREHNLFVENNTKDISLSLNTSTTPPNECVEKIKTLL